MRQDLRFTGILNTDDPEAEVPFGQHINASNVTFRGNGATKRVQNVVGTTAISNADLPSGTNECIGSFYDQLRQRIYWFNWNSNSRHGIYYYDIKTATVVPLLICFTDSLDDILDFDRDFPIASINIIYSSEEETDIGDTIFWVARNNRPQKLNIKDAIDNLYGASWLVDYLTVARKMPLYSPFCDYVDDATVTINNLRKKLYQFRYRWIYKDLTKSTWSPYSKLFAPANPDDVANDIDPTKNNRIDVDVTTGDADVIKIEIAARQTLIDTFSDCFSIVTIDKEDLGLLDNELYTYSFYNDQSYTTIDPEETDLLFDYVPKIANAQELLNGNVIIYGGIVENYDFNETLDVDFSVSSVAFSSAAAMTVSLLFRFSTITEYTSPDPKRLTQLAFSVNGSPNTGDVITISFISQLIGAGDTITYTVLPGDTTEDVANGLIAAFNVLSASGLNIYVASTYGVILNEWQIEMVSPYGPPENEGIADGADGLNVNNIAITYASSSNPVDGVSNSIFKHKSRYGFGLVYFDRFGVTNGVVTNDFMLIETPEISTTGQTASTIPKIDVEVNHQPPIWATNFSFVRTANLSVQTLLSTVSADTLKDTSSTINYAYINIRNQQNNEFGYTAYEFTEGDRVRIIGRYGQAITTVYDFPISSFKTNPTINAATQAGDWLVLPYNSVLSDFGTGVNYRHYDIEIYTPAINTTEAEQFYYEFGETYEVLDPYTSSRRHQGQTQNQIFNTQPALFSFIRGDFYIKQRKIPFAADLSNVNNVYIIDQSVSDLFPSKVAGNGRAFVVDEFAKESYFPTMVRWGLDYQQDTNINDTNRFYPQNFDVVDRSKGDIQRLKARDRMLRVFQNRGVGQYGIYARFIQNNSTGTELVTTNDIITTNNIQYYQGEFGLGTQYTGLASASNADYFADPVRGVQCRVAQDGITPISVLYKGQFYIRTLLTPYNKNYVRQNGAISKILGFYDYYEEQYHCILQEGEFGESTIGSYNFSFNEARNGYASFYSWIPEWVIGAEDITYSWFQGALYIHNNTTDYCKFYGTQYNASIQVVFNQGLLQKKTWEAVTEVANNIWICPTIYTNAISYVGTPNVYQNSSLISNDFVTLEGNYHAPFLRDASSIGGILEGETLKGNWIAITFSITTASDLYYLSEVSVNFVDSPLTQR